MFVNPAAFACLPFLFKPPKIYVEQQLREFVQSPRQLRIVLIGSVGRT